MKRFLTLILILTAFQMLEVNHNNVMSQTVTDMKVASEPGDPKDRNNNFYDNTEMYALPGSPLIIAGEVERPGPADLSGLPLRSIITKEALLKDGGGNRFVGAYRYDGYSLFDILENRILNKKNKEAYRPIIDLYVIIENNKGDKVVLSWGEIYYPNHLHEILIATRVGRIVPSKTNDLWPLPQESKLIIGNDLLSERNISNPVKITVKSYAREIPVNRDLKPLYSPGFKITSDSKVLGEITTLPEGTRKETFNAIFYGRGRGIHSTTPFNGALLVDIIKPYVSISSKDLKTGLVVVIGLDGYRCVYSLSEIVNRSDQEEVLLVDAKADDGSGQYRLYPACDFFSDRAIKAISEISLTTAE